MLIGGVRRPLAGTVTMDQLVVDCGQGPEVSVGDEVVLLGRSGTEEITADEWAARVGTISYEVLCRRRPPRAPGAPPVNGEGRDGPGAAVPGRRWGPLLSVGAAAVGAVGVAAYAAQRRASRRWLTDDAVLTAAGLTLPGDVRHHTVTVDDGGRIHVVERGQGPAVVLVHGVTLGVATWVHQLRRLSERHRVVAIGQRGHGRSSAGEGGYGMERLADDVLAVLEALNLRGAVLVGHSLGGMVAQMLALRHPGRLGERVVALGLVATTPGPVVLGPGGLSLAHLLAAGGGRGLRMGERHGRGVLPQGDLAAWGRGPPSGPIRGRPTWRSPARMLEAMSPSAMAELLGPLLSFDVRQQLGTVELPTGVVVGSRDLLTPPAGRAPSGPAAAGATLTVLPGCGHMVMLERPDELGELISAWSAARRPGPPG